MIHKLRLALVCCCAAHAQNGDLTGPLLGFSFEPLHGEVRPIWGTPGAATQGLPLSLAEPERTGRGRPTGTAVFRRVAISPRGDSFLAAGPESLIHGALRTEPVPGTFGGAARIAFSPSGSHAIAFYGATRMLQVLRIDQAKIEPVRQWETDLAISAIAVSDDGQFVLTASSDTVWLWRADAAAAQAVPDFVAPTSVAFVPGTSEGLVADGQTRTAWLISSTGQTTILAGPDQGLREPAAIRASANGSRVFIADRGAHAVAIIDRGSGESALLRCDCVPTALDSLTDPHLFRISSAAGDPLWLLDVRSAEPRLQFVPAAGERR